MLSLSGCSWFSRLLNIATTIWLSRHFFNRWPFKLSPRLLLGKHFQHLYHRVHSIHLRWMLVGTIRSATIDTKFTFNIWMNIDTFLTKTTFREKWTILFRVHKRACVISISALWPMLTSYSLFISKCCCILYLFFIIILSLCWSNVILVGC